jgi:serine/threonine-protein kinase HipA
MARELWIYVGERRAGKLRSEHDALKFEYVADDVSAISVRLPPRKEPYDDAACRPFFSNLLPESEWRQSLCRQLGIAVEDDFGLLEAIGGECAGAVSVRADADWKPSRGRYVPTTEQTLAKWTKNPAARPKIVASPGLRLSLAGAQDKLLVHLEGKKPFLCENGAPSTVLLKPDIHDALNAIHESALNELACMELARAAGLEVPRTFWFASALAIERFDRTREGKAWRRLHQEDFAQILGLPALAKYEVTWKSCFEVVTEHTATPSKERLALLDRLLFNLMLGNNDAHAKNFALLHERSGAVRLSPAYDLVATSLYPSLSERFAMPIGHAKTLAELDDTAWRGFADDVEVALPFLKRRGIELARTVTVALPGLAERLDRENPKLAKDVYPLRRRRELVERLLELVARNARAVTRSLGDKRR